ncbi:MAG: hypothetical protein SFU56_09615 [Capsulimonadales bacterium]|nr:hypothetical protein [Capsulimonadales bacterium]
MTMRSLCRLLIVTVLACGLLLPVNAKPIVTRGIYTDGRGGAHPWYINEAHQLIWEDRPFVPVGGRFQARSWVSNPTGSDFEADAAALKTLKRCGVTDIYLQPARGGLLSVPPTALQRLIDLLDAEGFTYGISINDAPAELLTGYEIRPGKYRHPVPEGGGLLRFPIRNAVSALYFQVSESGDVITTGKATPVDEGMRVVPSNVPGRNIVFLLPQHVHFNARSIGVPNVWEGFDQYRDDLIALFRKVKLGPGFRFFADPLSSDLRLTDDIDVFVPTNVSFRIEWSEWLGRRHRNIDNLLNAWGVSDRECRDFRDAADLLPLWWGGKGVALLYNPDTEKTYRVNTALSSYWKDLTAFKIESIRRYMNDLATVLKKAVADVPVVYRTTGYSALHTALPANRGFDGIGIEAFGRGSELVTQSAGYAYAHTAEAPKTMWLPVLATGDADPARKVARGYASRAALHADLDWLREIGARGFFVDGVRILDTDRKMYDLSEAEDQLTWLSDYARVLAITGVSGATALPRAVFYPRGLALASVRPLAEGGWWLPTERPHVPYDFGAAGKAYALAEPERGTVYYLWNPSGKRRIRLRIPKAARAPGAPALAWSPSAEGNVKGDILTMTIGPDPVRLINYPSVPVPLDAFKEYLDEGARMVAAMKKAEIPEGARYQLSLVGTERRFNVDNPLQSLMEIQRVVQEMREKLRPYAWIEAERAAAQNFDGVMERLGASGNLVLSTEERPAGAAPANAAYTIQITTPGNYTVWVAASPASLFSLRLNGRPLLDEAVLATPIGSRYADGQLVWQRLGNATLPRGVHTLEVRAETAAKLDVILLTREPFEPDGPNPPALKL